MNNKIKTAEDFAKEQREISVSEFFAKNKHLLGFDNPRKALLTTIKEAVDNSLDACDEARILPEVIIKVKQLSEERFEILVEDNGPGIVKEQIPNIFAKLLYGSKFHRLKMSRGQQGIGISAAALYGQLTTGKPIKIVSKPQNAKLAQYYELHIDTKKNKPEITTSTQINWEKKHGTKLELEIEAKYQEGRQGVFEYLKQTAIVNPHLELIYHDPEGKKIVFPRGTNSLPREPQEIKPHPYGVSLGNFITMLRDTKARTLSSFLQKDFSRISSKVAKQICSKAGINENTKSIKVTRDEAEKIVNAIKETKIMAPPTNCVTPIGEDLIIKGLKKEIKADFYAAVTRSPDVYSGNPFIIECCTGDTKLILENGEIINIKEFVESNLISKKVLSMNSDLKIVPSKVLAVHKIKNYHKIFKIKTRTGKDLKITGNNEVPIIDNGKVIWRKVEECMAGDFIATPRQIGVNGEVPSIIDLLEPYYIQIAEREIILRIMNKLKSKFGSYKNAAKKLNVNYDRFKALKRSGNATRPTLEFLKKMCQEAEEDYDLIKEQIKKIRYVDTNHKNPNLISLPNFNEDLLYIVGLLNSDGYISKYTVSFINLDKSLHLSFKEKIEKLFSIKAHSYKNTTYINNKTLSVILKAIMKNLTKLHDTLILAWLKGFVDGDGWVQIKEGKLLKSIGIATAKKEKAELVQTLLLRFGIISKIERVAVPSKFGKIGHREIRTKSPQYNVIIYDYGNAQKFHSLISFRQKKRFEILNKSMKNKIKPFNKSDIIPLGSVFTDFRKENNLTQYQLGFSDQSIRQIEKNKQNLTRNNLQQILLLPELTGVTFHMFKKLAFSDILWDKIIDIELIPNENFVYDLTVEEGNFIANNIVMHNCGIAYGGELLSEEQARLMRFANRVPLLYQQSACAVTRSIIKTDWRNYGLSQSKDALPVGPVLILVHIASVWVPFTSESKEAIAHYPEIIKEIKLALQECGRKVGGFIRARKRSELEIKRKGYIEKYLPHIGTALREIAELNENQEKIVIKNLKEVLEKSRS